MALNKKKISDYPIADSLVGLWTLGYSAVDGIKKSFRVSLEFLKNAADRATLSAQSADTAAAAATSAAEGANTAAAAATSAAQDAENNVTDVAELQSKVAVNADAIATNSARIAELQGRGGSIPAAAFGADDPASEGMQEAFTHHAANAIWGADGTFAWNSVEPAASTWTSADGATVHTAAEIFNSTWTRNTDNGHRIVLNNTQDTDPAVFEWSDVGVDTVNVATDTAAGIVLSDASGGEFVVDPATGSVTLAEQVATPGTIVENTTKFSSGVRKTLKAWMGDLFTKVNGIISEQSTKAPLASPSFTGTPTAPTPLAGDNSTRLATTAFVKTVLNVEQIDYTSEIEQAIPGKVIQTSNFGIKQVYGRVVKGTLKPSGFVQVMAQDCVPVRIEGHVFDDRQMGRIIDISRYVIFSNNEAAGKNFLTISANSALTEAKPFCAWVEYCKI